MFQNDIVIDFTEKHLPTVPFILTPALNLDNLKHCLPDLLYF